MVEPIKPGDPLYETLLKKIGGYGIYEGNVYFRVMDNDTVIFAVDDINKPLRYSNFRPSKFSEYGIGEIRVKPEETDLGFD